MADVNVLDLTPSTPGSDDSLILFDSNTGVAKSTGYTTLRDQVLGSKFSDTSLANGDVYQYNSTSGKFENTDAIGSLNEALTKQTLYFTSVACSATTGNFATVSNANISADHVVVECTFANPSAITTSAITTDVTWTTANGSLTLNGTCTSATTANITLSKKGN